MNCWQNCECDVNKKKEQISGNCDIIEIDMGVNQLTDEVPRHPRHARDHAQTRGSKQRQRKEQLPEVKYENASANEKKGHDDWSSDTSTDESEMDGEDASPPKVMSTYGKNVSAPKGAKTDGTKRAHNRAVVPAKNLSPREEKELQDTYQECEELMCHPECKHLEEEVNCEWLGHLVTEDNCGSTKKDQVKGFGVLKNARHLVSKSKKRYINKKDGFDLDLVYITNRVIAMGFPSVGAEKMYRNPREECVRFLDTYHKGRWRIYNLCSEKAHQYPPDTFGGNWRGFPFDDHCPPTLNLIVEFCLEASQFMQKHPDNVIAVHCKAGKGRTGTMICGLMLYAYGAPDTLEGILRDYGARRSWKGAGVTIPAQIHALSLFAECISGPSKIRQPASFLSNPCVKGDKPACFHLRELVIGPFYSARVNNPSLRTFFGDIKNGHQRDQLPGITDILERVKIEIERKGHLRSSDAAG